MSFQNTEAPSSADRGRDDRFSRPAAPSLRHRPSHFRAVRSLIPKPAATSGTGRPSSTIRLTISARPSGVIRAFLCGLFILVTLGVSLRNEHLQDSTTDEQPIRIPHLGGCATALRDAAGDGADDAVLDAAHRDLAEMRCVLFEALGRLP